MINLPLNEWWLPILGFIPIVVAAFSIKKKKKVTKDSWVEIIIGAFVVLLSINDNYNNATERINNSDSLHIIHSAVKNLQDTLHTTRDSLLKVGLEIDGKTGKILIIDSQLLKRRFTQTIYHIIYTGNNDSANSKKLSKYFSDLSNVDYYKREIAVDYVTKQFPDTLSHFQIDQIYKYITLSNQPAIVSVLLADQPASKYLTSIIKEIITKRNTTEQYCWTYLFRKTNLDLPFIESVVKLNPNNSWMFYTAIIEIALNIDNSKVCFELLNSQSLISLLTSNKNAIVQQGFNTISTVIKNSPKYEEYKNTYLFKAMRTN